MAMRGARWLMAAVLVLAGLWSGSSASAQQEPKQEKRIALVIGNSNYAKGPIPTAANDAGLIAQTLQAAGFDVVGARDLDGDTLRGSFRDFIQKAEASGPNTVAVIYLAGYGVQLAGENYFIPVDSKIERDADIPIEGLRISDYMRQLAALPLQASVVVLDAARQQPFIENAQIASGLALMEPDKNMLIAFNAAPGTVAPEEEGNYGAYAQALAEMVRAGGLPLPQLFDQVRLRVNETTKGAFVPWDAQKIDTPFVFFDRAPDAPPLPSAQDEAARAAKPIRDLGAQDAYAAALDRDTLQGYEDFLAAYPDDPMTKRVRAIVAARREAITWRRTYHTDTPDAYWSYLRRYPNGPHAEDARRRLAILSAALEPPQSFAMIDYDVPPPPPDEVVYVDRPVLMFSDPDFGFAPPPPPPVYYLPPPPPDFIDLPPPLAIAGLFLLPQPVFVPIPVFVRPPRYIAPPPNNIIFANIHNRTVIDNEINRPRAPQFQNRVPGGPAGQIFAPGQKGPPGGVGQRPVIQAGVGPALPGAVQRRSALINEGKLPRPASSFINPRVGQGQNQGQSQGQNQGQPNVRGNLPGPRRFDRSGPVPAAGTSPAAQPPGARPGPVAPQAIPNRNGLPVPGQGGVPNAPRGPGARQSGPQGQPPELPGRPGRPGTAAPSANPAVAPNVTRPGQPAGQGVPPGVPSRAGNRSPNPALVRPQGQPNARPQPPSERPGRQFQRPPQAPPVQRPPQFQRPAPQIRPPQPAAQPPRPAPQAPRFTPPPRQAPVARPSAPPPPAVRPPPRPAPVARPAAPPRPAPRAPAPAPKKCPPNVPKC